MSGAVEKAVRTIAPKAQDLFGVSLEGATVETLATYAQELLRWNRVFNLTAITEPERVAELHILDSLAILPELPESARIIDVGSGAGLPGLVAAAVRRDVQVTPVDRTEKKVLFMKNTAAKLGLENVRPVHVRLEGDPAREGMSSFDVAVSRAFTSPPEWIALARNYVRGGGKIIAMLGSELPDWAALEASLGSDRLIVDRPYQLPSGAKRRLLVVERADQRS